MFAIPAVLSGPSETWHTLALTLRDVLTALCQTAAGINLGFHDHRNRTEVLVKVLVSNRRGEPRLAAMSGVLQTQWAQLFHADWQDMH